MIVKVGGGGGVDPDADYVWNGSHTFSVPILPAKVGIGAAPSANLFKATGTVGSTTINSEGAIDTGTLMIGGGNAYFNAAGIDLANMTIAFRLAAFGAITTFIRIGTGSPEGVVSSPPSSIYLRTDGGAGSTLYVKESGTGNTGWVAK